MFAQGYRELGKQLSNILFHCLTVDLSSKVEDNGYLRLWRASVEMDATPKAVLHRVLMEQHLWDPSLRQSKILEVLDDDTDIYHYTTESMSPLPLRDHVILR